MPEEPHFVQCATVINTLESVAGEVGQAIGKNFPSKAWGECHSLGNHKENQGSYHGYHDDETFTYGGTTDKYELKIRAIVKAYLSSNASGYLGKVNFGTVRGKIICRIEAKKCKPDDFVYSYCKYGPTKPEVAEIYKRFGNQKRRLEGVAGGQIRISSGRGRLSSCNAGRLFFVFGTDGTDGTDRTDLL